MKINLFVVLYFTLFSALNALYSESLIPWFTSIKHQNLFRFNVDEINQMILSAANGVNDHGELRNKKHKVFVCDDSRFFIPGFTRVNSIDEIDQNIVSDSVFVVFFHTDDDYIYTLKKINEGKGKYFSLPYSPKTRYMWVDKNAMRAYDKTLSFGSRTSHHDASFSPAIHETICQVINTTKSLPGDYVEIGVYKGGSALTALHYMNFSTINRKCYFLDTFHGMTYHEAHESADVIWYNTHTLFGPKKTMEYVHGLLSTTGQSFELVENNVCTDLFPNSIKQIAVCNIDVDLYEATLAALIKVGPLMVKGGMIICEDPTSTPGLGGALLAMEEFLETSNGKEFIKILNSAQYLLIKGDRETRLFE